MEKPRRSKRRTELPKPDYKEYDEPSKDSFIHCHLCNDLKIGPFQEEGHCLKIAHYSSFQAIEAEVFMHWLNEKRRAEACQTKPKHPQVSTRFATSGSDTSYDRHDKLIAVPHKMTVGITNV